MNRITIVPWNHRNEHQVPEQASQDAPALTEENFPGLPSSTQSVIPRPHPSGSHWAEIVSSGRRFTFYNAFPLEIRQLVAEHYMHAGNYTTGEIDVDGWRYKSPDSAMSTRFPRFLPPLCYASKQTFTEAALVVISDADWKIRSVKANEWLTEFLNTFTVPGKDSLIGDEIGFRALRRIHFSSFHRFRGVREMGRNLDFELMKRCTGLKELTLTFHVSVTHWWHAGEGEEILRSVEEIVDFYGLEDIFQCRSLRKFKIDAITRVDYWTEAEERLEDVGSWVRDGFLKRFNQVVDVELKWRTHSYRVGPYPF